MTPMTMVFGREKSFRLGESSFPIHEDFSLGLTNRTKYKYDAWNRLTAVYEDDQGEAGDPIAAYSYDGQNHRVTKTLADETVTEYYYNRQWQVLEEQSFNDQRVLAGVNDYVWSPQYIDAPVVRFHDGNADGDCDPTTDADDTIRYYTWDANHNVTTTITDGYGVGNDATLHYVYTSYGEATVCDENWSNLAAPTEDGPLYCGYFFDAETANYLARNRYYSPSLSTWVSRDPVAADINLYRYCVNDPVTRIDPTGLEVRLQLPSGQVLTAPDGCTIAWFTDGWYEIICPGGITWGYWNLPPVPKPAPTAPPEPENPSKTAEWCKHMASPASQACAEAIVHGDLPPFDTALSALECASEAAKPCVTLALQNRYIRIRDYYGAQSAEAAYADGELEAYKEGRLCEYTRQHPLPHPRPGKQRYIPACQCGATPK